MKSALLFFAQLFFIWAIYEFSSYIIKTFDVPIPASVLGIIILYTMLSTGIIKLRHIEKGVGFLNKHLGFFFVPIAVGLINYGGLIKAHGLELVLMIAGSTVVGLVITAGTTQYLSKKERALTRKERTYHGQSHSA
ncbi:CidA/LrgA family protein [Cytobacillus depressus]|uniref:CidA/LrgA family protein n=1 Tax=Cytobacillus depressus TaxID=1602942 RepID=UPI001FE50F28|nr:CidA/LrgA family protein [Cytobacillus depressus]